MCSSDLPNYRLRRISFDGHCKCFLQQNNLASKRLNSADYVVTDARFRDARVLWEASEQRVAALQQEFQSHSTLVLQGFIGATQDSAKDASQDFFEKKKLTSLGREGSDFSAAIFAYLLNAESVTIWKDVPGLLNADPKCFEPKIGRAHV